MSDNNLKYCNHCGTRAEYPEQKYCSNCGAKLPDISYSSTYGTNEKQNPFGSAFDSVDNPERQSGYRQPVPKMKWYFFLVYFILLISAFNNVISGFEYILGDHYILVSKGLSYAQIPASELYATFGIKYKITDILFGIGMITVGAFAVYTHFSLKRFKKNAPKKLTLFYILTGAVQLLYFIAIYMITGESQTVQIVAIMISALFWILINRSYFKKREHLFVN